MNRRGICLILGLLFLFFPHSALGEAPRERALTVMVYMTGSDLESNYGAASNDIDEMLQVGINTRQVNVVVMTGGSKLWRNGQSEDSTVINRVKGTQLVAEQSISAMNMGEADTLCFFLNYCTQNYPAQAYALIFWDHGGGPMDGVCYDDLNNRDSLSLAEIDRAFAGSAFGGDNRLSWIGFDACLMASLETAHTCAPYADYMIASQETEPVTGWNYGFLSSIDSQPDSEALARTIISDFMNVSNKDRWLTLSCVNLRKIGMIEEMVSQQFKEIAAELTRENYSGLMAQRQSATALGRVTTSFEYDLVDLYSLFRQFTSNMPDRLTAMDDAMSEVVIINQTNLEDVHGLSLYAPYYNKKYYSKWNDKKSPMSEPKGYSVFLDRFEDIWLGDQLTDWSRLEYHALAMEDSQSQGVELKLTEEQIANLESVEMIVLRKTGDSGTYQKIYQSDKLPRQGNTFHCEYDFNALYVLDENGHRLTDELAYEMIDGYYILYPVFENISQTQASSNNAFGLVMHQYAQPLRTVLGMSRLRREEGQNALVIEDLTAVRADVVSVENAGLINPRQGMELDIDKWPLIDFNYGSMSGLPTRNDLGQLLPFDEWEAQYLGTNNGVYVDTNGERITDIMEVFNDSLSYYLNGNNSSVGIYPLGVIERRKPWHLEFQKSENIRFGYYAQFIITDTQGIRTATELIPLHNACMLYASDEMNLSVYNGGNVEAEAILKGISIIEDTVVPGVYLEFEIINNWSTSLAFSLDDFKINGIPTAGFYNIPSIDPGKQTTAYIRIDFADLPPIGDSRIRSIEFKPEFSYIPPLEKAMAYEDEILREYYGDRVVIPLDIAIDALPPDIDSPNIRYDCDDYEPAGSVKRDNLCFQLLDLRLTGERSFEGLLRIVNCGEAPCSVRFPQAGSGRHVVRINEFCVPKGLVMGETLELPARGDGIMPFAVELSELPPVFGLDPARFDIADYWNIREIDALTIYADIREQGSDSSEGIPPERTVIAGAISACVATKIQLDHPLALFADADPNRYPRQNLIDIDDLALDIRGLSWKEGAVYIDLDVINRNNLAVSLILDSIRVDDRPALAQVFCDYSDYETCDPDYRCSFYTIPGNTCEHCVIILSDPNGSAYQGTIREINMSVAYQIGEGIRKYPQDIRIGLPEDTDEDEVALTADTLKLSCSSQLLAVIPVDGVPGHEYEACLRVAIPEERFEHIVSFAAFIVEDNRSLKDLYPIFCRLSDAPRYDNGYACVDFCGLLPSSGNGNIPFQSKCRREDNGWTYILEDVEIDGYSGPMGLGDYSFSRLTMKGDPTFPSAFRDMETADFSEDKGASPMIRFYHRMLSIHRLEDGTFGLPEYTDYFLNYADPFDGDVPRFSFVPAVRFDPLIAFCFQYADGASECKMLRYSEATS